jgi:hypothetical protein
VAIANGEEKLNEKHYRVPQHNVVRDYPVRGGERARIVLANTRNPRVAFRRSLAGLGKLVDVVGNKTGYQQEQVPVRAN